MIRVMLVSDFLCRAGNSAGVTRYRTRHGWISELVRGSGRQPVAEVISVGLTVSEESVYVSEFRIAGCLLSLFFFFTINVDKVR